VVLYLKKTVKSITVRGVTDAEKIEERQIDLLSFYRQRTKQQKRIGKVGRSLLDTTEGSKEGQPCRSDVNEKKDGEKDNKRSS